MSANTSAAAPAKSKKMLVIIIGVVLAVLIIGGAAAVWLVSRQANADEDGAGRQAAKAAPTFLSVDNMVVNLADPGGDRFVQIGITLELADDKTVDQVKSYLPSIRSGILMLVSQRTSGELLQVEGKEKLALDIRQEVSKPLGFGAAPARARSDADDAEANSEAEEDRPSPRRLDRSPVRRVLFSSFIIQ